MPDDTLLAHFLNYIHNHQVNPTQASHDRLLTFVADNRVSVTTLVNEFLGIINQQKQDAVLEQLQHVQTEAETLGVEDKTLQIIAESTGKIELNTEGVIK